MRQLSEGVSPALPQRQGRKLTTGRSSRRKAAGPCEINGKPDSYTDCPPTEACQLAEQHWPKNLERYRRSCRDITLYALDRYGRGSSQALFEELSRAINPSRAAIRQ